MNWASKRNINYAADVNVPDFCLSEKEFPSAKAMAANRYMGPLRYLVLQLRDSHHVYLHHFLMPEGVDSMRRNSFKENHVHNNRSGNSWYGSSVRIMVRVL